MDALELTRALGNIHYPTLYKDEEELRDVYWKLSECLSRLQNAEARLKGTTGLTSLNKRNINGKMRSCIIRVEDNTIICTVQELYAEIHRLKYERKTLDAAYTKAWLHYMDMKKHRDEPLYKLKERKAELEEQLALVNKLISEIERAC